LRGDLPKIKNPLNSCGYADRFSIMKTELGTQSQKKIYVLAAWSLTEPSFLAIGDGFSSHLYDVTIWQGSEKPRLEGLAGGRH
jgi:hypothetical protein